MIPFGKLDAFQRIQLEVS